MADQIRCPHCRAQFEVTEAVAEQLREQLRREIDSEARRRDAAFAQREQALLRRERDLNTTVQERLASERPQLINEAREAFLQELKDRDAQLAETRERLDQARATELQLRKERRELEDQRRELELTVQRTLDEERARMQERIRREADEDHRLKSAEKDKLVDELRRQIDDMKRKAAPVPPQTQGEVLEQELEQLLRARFPLDTFAPVPIGQHGGDIIQHVRDETGRDCGKILWETKRTKRWEAAWLPKLREDQRQARARVAVIMSQEMPRDFPDFGCIDGVYVTRRICAISVATVLRLALVGIAQAERAVQNRHGKVEQLVAYICSSEFHQQVAGLVEALTTMQEDLDKEKRAIEKLWAKRLKQIAIALGSTISFRGDLEGILGGTCGPSEDLELPAAPDAA
jgi:hypothetical protein